MSTSEAATALYYTLSTIAQTLAGSLGILVAVVLFRLAALGRMIEEGKAEMDTRNVNSTMAWPILRDRGFDAFADWADQELHITNLKHHRPLRTASERAYNAFQSWGSINRWLYVTVGATVSDIALCFIALPFTHALTASGRGAWVATASVGLGVVCVGLYSGLIVTMVKRPRK